MIEAFAKAMENFYVSPMLFYHENIAGGREWAVSDEDGGVFYLEKVTGRTKIQDGRNCSPRSWHSIRRTRKYEPAIEAAGTASDRILPSLAGIKRDPALREKYYVQHSSRIPHTQHVCAWSCRVFGCSTFYQCDRKTHLLKQLYGFCAQSAACRVEIWTW